MTKNAVKSILLALTSLAVLQASTSPLAADERSGEPAAASSRQSLNGNWKIIFDRTNLGVPHYLASGGVAANPQAEDIAVPSIWNTQKPAEREYTGAVIYERQFLAQPAGFDAAILRFQAVNYIAEVWLNGKKLGTHEGGYLPFEFDVTGQLQAGETNTLTVRVIDFDRTGKEFEGRKISSAATGKETWYYNFGGIYRDVDLFYYRVARIADVRINTAMDGRITIDPDIQKIGDEGFTARYELRDHEGRVVAAKTVEVADQLVDARMELAIANPRLWSPKDPYLYDFHMTVESQGAVVDTYATKIGVRTILFDKGSFVLNGKKIILKGILLQPSYPVGLVDPVDPQMEVDELNLVKKAGFNMIRLHVRPGSERYLRLCDELGLLVYQESPIAWMKYDPNALGLYQNEIRDMAHNAYNHPSVVILGITNENWHQEHDGRKKLAEYLQSIDKSRVIIDVSGISGFCATVYCEFGQAWYGGATASGQLTPAEDIHAYWEIPLPTRNFDFIKNIGNASVLRQYGTFLVNQSEAQVFYDRTENTAKNGGQMFMSEFGAGGLPDFRSVIARYQKYPSLNPKDAEIVTQAYESFVSAAEKIPAYTQGGGYDFFLALSQEIQAQGFVRQVEAMRINPVISGWSATQLNDASGEMYAGILDVWRQPKKAYSAFAGVLKDVILVLDDAPVRLYGGSNFKSNILAVNDSGRDWEDCRVAISVTDGSGKPIYEQEWKCRVPKGVSTPAALDFTTPETEGGLTIQAVLKSPDGKLLAEKKTTTALYKRNDSKVAGKTVHFIGGGYEGYERLVAVTGDINQADIVVVGSCNADHADVTAKVKKSISEGKKVIVLRQEPTHKPETNIYAAPDFPVSPPLLASEGTFAPNLHYLNRTKYTEGVPNNTLMDDRFRDLIPNRSLNLPAGEISAGVLGNGCGPAWSHCTDLCEVSVGGSKMLLCQIPIASQYGVDPMSDRLFRNFVENL